MEKTMTDKVYNMLVEILIEEQGNGEFNDSIEEYIDFESLTKEEASWYFKNYIVHNVDMDSYVETYNAKEDFKNYAKEMF